MYCIFALVVLLFPFILAFKVLGWVVAAKVTVLVMCFGWLCISVFWIVSAVYSRYRLWKEIEDYNNRHNEDNRNIRNVNA